MKRARVIALASGAALLALLALPQAALADNCSNLSDCYSTVSGMAAVATGISVVFIFTVWLAPDRCDGLREACRQARAEADAADAEARQLDRRAQELATETGGPLERARRAREALARLDRDEANWSEVTQGRLAGVRLNADDLRRMRAEERDVRDRYARGEITVQERERLLARWADEDYVRQRAAQWAQERADERKRLQQELASAEAETGPAEHELEQARERARAAQEAARAARARADALCAEASDCDAGLPPPEIPPIAKATSGVASGADEREQP